MSAHSRHGSILLLTLLILGVSVMLAATFVTMMATYQASGIRQSGRQIAAQTALAGAVYAEQTFLRDYHASQVNGVPQRYNDLYWTNNTNSALDGAPGRYPAALADRIGLDWKLPFEGTIAGRGGAWVSGSGMARIQYRDNQYGWSNKYGYFQGLRTDPTRGIYIDSMEASQQVPLQYAAWDGTWYSADGNPINYGDLNSEFIYRSSLLTSPRWLTSSYYDGDYQPLDPADRDLAAYEARFSVLPIPLDGCLSINFGDRILSQNTGGRYRLGQRNPQIPPGPTLELSPGIVAAAAAAGRSTFKNDAEDFDRGNKGALSYHIGDTCSVSVAADVPYQAYLLEPGDIDWAGARFPLAQQYGTAFANMLGVMVVTDGGANVAVRKLSNVVFTGMPAVPPTKYDTYTVDVEVVKTGGLYKASAGIGTLSKIAKIVMGQGYNGNFHGYNTAINDLWADPSVPAQIQVGTPATWRQFHATLGYSQPSTGIKYTSNVTAGDRILQIMSFVVSPFAAGLDRGQIPVRNKGSADPADIDCPWYVNIMFANRDTAHAMMCAMDPQWYANFDNKNGNTGNSDGFPLNQSNLMPTPPDKACPVRGAAYAAKWNDGVARTGADGVEGGALPPLNVAETGILGTGYLRPPRADGEAGHYFRDDAFAGNAPLVWKNPVRDELIWPKSTSVGQHVYTYRGAPYAAATGSMPWILRPSVAFALRGMSGTNPKPAQIESMEDQVNTVVTGGAADQAHAFENFPKGAEDALNDNTDPIDERLSWQDDIIAALMKTVVDCHIDRKYGKRLRPGTFHGYEMIEDVETVFLAHLGISVRYRPVESKASTTAVSAGDYLIYTGAPGTADATWPLGKMNQLWALSQLTSEIGHDRSLACTNDASININQDGLAGQLGFRHYAAKVAQNADGTWPPGWPTGYQPTWAALSRILEHRLNDVRMSLFGTPALDFNQDGYVDATTNDLSGVVTSTVLDTPGAQMHFSSTGRWQIGRNRFWRIFIKAELWDRRQDRLASESALEQVIVIDPDGDGNLGDTRSLFRRWHGNYATSGRNGPTREGRTEATLP